MAGLDEVVGSGFFRFSTPASADAVWAALTGAETTPHYFHGMALVSAWTADSPIVFQPPARSPALAGEVLCVRPGEHLAYTIEDTATGTATYLAWTIRPAPWGSVVRLQVHETGASPSSEEELEDVWLPVLDALRDLLAGSPPR